jgi:hypothetical protein
MYDKIPKQNAVGLNAKNIAKFSNSSTQMFGLNGSLEGYGKGLDKNNTLSGVAVNSIC